MVETRELLFYHTYEHNKITSLPNGRMRLPKNLLLLFPPLKVFFFVLFIVGRSWGGNSIRTKKAENNLDIFFIFKTNFTVKKLSKWNECFVVAIIRSTFGFNFFKRQNQIVPGFNNKIVFYSNFLWFDQNLWFQK